MEHRLELVFYYFKNNHNSKLKIFKFWVVLFEEWWLGLKTISIFFFYKSHIMPNLYFKWRDRLMLIIYYVLIKNVQIKFQRICFIKNLNNFWNQKTYFSNRKKILNKIFKLFFWIVFKLIFESKKKKQMFYIPMLYFMTMLIWTYLFEYLMT